MTGHKVAIGHKVPNAEALRYAERLARVVRLRADAQTMSSDATIAATLGAVFEDKEIQDNFVGAEIRYTAMCGEVAREVLRLIGSSPDRIALLSIGDVDLPDFAREGIDAIVECAHRIHRELSAEETYGYDLSSRGSLRARRALVEFLEPHYGLGGLSCAPDRLAENMAICAGGMRGLDDIATAHVRLAQSSKWPRFIHPDNSFGTWHAIAGLRSVGGKVASVHVLPTSPENLLHLSADDVRAFYGRDRTSMEGRPTRDLWCITPVGNPSGTAIDDAGLTQVCHEIVTGNAEATILLDCTYVRTLPVADARGLMRGVVTSPEISQRVIFLDSFSKSHGICGERIGMYFSANRLLFDEHHNVNMMLSAGNGRHKSAMAFAIASADPLHRQSIDALHRFWQRERLGLYWYLLASGRFADLFAQEQQHLTRDQLGKPLGLYLFLKLRDGVSAQNVLLRTGCLGVETPMASGQYIRFAVGKLTSETYSHYIGIS